MLKTIAIDGPDYSGKSTLCRMVKNMLLAMDIKATVINHPTTAGLHGKCARMHILQGSSQETVSAALCMDFKDTLDNVVPEYDVVIFDRYCASTISYQGEAGKAEVFKSGVLKHENSPKLHVSIDVDYQTALERAKKRTAEVGQSWDDVVLTSHHLATEENWNSLRLRYRFAENVLSSCGVSVLAPNMDDIRKVAAKIVNMIVED